MTPKRRPILGRFELLVIVTILGLVTLIAFFGEDDRTDAATTTEQKL